MTTHVSAKHKIKELTRSEFEKVLIDSLLTENERKIMYMAYVEHKTFGYIADVLGYSYSAIKAKHKHAINKISKLL